MVKTAMQRFLHKEQEIYNAWIKAKEHKASKSLSQWVNELQEASAAFIIQPCLENDWKYQQSKNTGTV